MAIIKVHDKYFVPFLSEQEIQARVKEIAVQINNDYTGKTPLSIAILNGSFMFASDLFKNISLDAEICFIKLASYKGTKSSGQVITAIGLDIDIKDRHVIITEDIIDTGKTLNAFLPQIVNQQPASLKIAVLLQISSKTTDKQIFLLKIRKLTDVIYRERVLHDTKIQDICYLLWQ